MIRELFAKSIWAKDAIPADEWKYRNLKRVMFPVMDVIFFLSGISAAYYGVPAISEFFPRYVVDTGATVLSLAGIIAFFGVAFPTLWGWEVLAKSVILGLFTGYFVALFLLTRAGEGNRGFVLGVVLIVICVIMWRLSLLGNEWQDRRVAAKRAAQRAAATGEVPTHAD